MSLIIGNTTIAGAYLGSLAASRAYIGSVIIYDGVTSYDYVIDSVNGNDSNDGLTPGTAWSTLSKIDESLLVKEAEINILVKSGTYDTVDDNIIIQSGNNDVLNAILNINFEKNTVADGVSMSGSENFLEQSGNIQWTLNILGNRLDIRNYNDSTSLSPNAIGNRGVTTVNVYDVDITNCEDGFSCHGDAFMNIHNSTASECNKSPFIHVDNATVTASNSIFTEKIGGGSASMSVTDTLSNCTITATHCEWIPDSSTVQSKFVGTFNTCQMGDLSSSIVLSTSNSNPAIFNDCFINIYMDGNNDASFNRCFGKFSTRLRSGGSLDMQNSVITSPASGQTNIIFSNFNSGGASPTVFNNNIIQASSGFMSIDATNSGHLVTANAQFFNNSLFGGVSYDSDLIAADVGGLIIVDTLTSDPLIGASNSLLMLDYAYGAGSPCIGAGTLSSNIGYSEQESVSVGSTLVPEVNIILNSTFDDASDLTVPATWNLTGNTANYTRVGSDFFLIDLSEQITVGDEIRIDFDIISSTLSGARFIIGMGNSSSNEVIRSVQIYPLGANSVTYTITSDTETNIYLRGSTSGGGGEFSVDNITLTKLN